MRIQHALGLKGPLEPARSNQLDAFKRTTDTGQATGAGRPSAGDATGPRRGSLASVTGSEAQRTTSTRSNHWDAGDAWLSPPALPPAVSMPAKGMRSTREDYPLRPPDIGYRASVDPPRSDPAAPQAFAPRAMRSTRMDLEGIGTFALGPSPTQQRFGTANTVRGTTANFGRGNAVNLNALLAGQSTRQPVGMLAGAGVGGGGALRTPTVIGDGANPSTRGRSSVLSDPEESAHGRARSTHSTGARREPPQHRASDSLDDGDFFPGSLAPPPTAMQRLVAPVQRAARAVGRRLSHIATGGRNSRPNAVSVAPEHESAFETDNDMPTQSLARSNSQRSQTTCAPSHPGRPSPPVPFRFPAAPLFPLSPHAFLSPVHHPSTRPLLLPQLRPSNEPHNVSQGHSGRQPQRLHAQSHHYVREQKVQFVPRGCGHSGADGEGYVGEGARAEHSSGGVKFAEQRKHGRGAERAFFCRACRHRCCRSSGLARRRPSAHALPPLALPASSSRTPRGQVRTVVMGENYNDLVVAYKGAFPEATQQADPTKYLLIWKAARVDYIRKRLRGTWDPDQNKPLPGFYLDPNGRFRRLWDGTLLLFVVFNAVEVPFAVGLNPPKMFELTIVDGVINILFGIDIVLGFFTAVSEGGRSAEARSQSTPQHCPPLDSEPNVKRHSEAHPGANGSAEAPAAPFVPIPAPPHLTRPHPPQSPYIPIRSSSPTASTLPGSTSAPGSRWTSPRPSPSTSSPSSWFKARGRISCACWASSRRRGCSAW